MTTTHCRGPPGTGYSVPPPVAPPPADTSVVSGLTEASATSASVSTAGREYDGVHLSFFGDGLFAGKMASLAECNPIAPDPLPTSTSFIPPPTSFDGLLVEHGRESTTISGSDLTEWHPGNWDAQDNLYYLTRYPGVNHDQLSGGNETDTGLFEDAVSERPIMRTPKRTKSESVQFATEWFPSTPTAVTASIAALFTSPNLIKIKLRQNLLVPNLRERTKSDSVRFSTDWVPSKPTSVTARIAALFASPNLLVPNMKALTLNPCPLCIGNTLNALTQDPSA